MSEAIDTEVLSRAYLETVYWWVDCEYDYHSVFSKPYHTSTIEGLQKAFYKFTIKYSVRRTVKKDEYGSLNLFLEELIKSSFRDDALESNSSLIDTTDYKLKGNSKRSLLSKFATLINPLGYTMYDTRGVTSLKSFGGPRKYSSYVQYHDSFKAYQKELESNIESADLNYYIKLCEKQGKPCPEDIFRNRLADKYLWVKQDLK